MSLPLSVPRLEPVSLLKKRKGEGGWNCRYVTTDVSTRGPVCTSRHLPETRPPHFYPFTYLLPTYLPIYLVTYYLLTTYSLTHLLIYLPVYYLVTFSLPLPATYLSPIYPPTYLPVS